MTDPAIVRGGLRTLGLPEADWPAEEAALMAVYLEVLAEICAAARDFRIHPGIEAALAVTADRPGFAVGLGTGNVADGARLKLERVGLFRYFAFGGFGSDHIDRATLIRIGAERGAARLGLPRDACRVVVIGDTPKDIAAARAIGADSIAVATGSYRVESLRGFAPTHAFASLADPGAAEALLR
jgi:phosphoglycolate phosphatase-like HAD superfamily hydrolase